MLTESFLKIYLRVNLHRDLFNVLVSTAFSVGTCSIETYLDHNPTKDQSSLVPLCRLRFCCFKVLLGITQVNKEPKS